MKDLAYKNVTLSLLSIIRFYSITKTISPITMFNSTTKETTSKKNWSIMALLKKRLAAKRYGRLSR